MSKRSVYKDLLSRDYRAVPTALARSLRAYTENVNQLEAVAVVKSFIEPFGLSEDEYRVTMGIALTAGLLAETGYFCVEDVDRVERMGFVNKRVATAARLSCKGMYESNVYSDPKATELEEALNYPVGMLSHVSRAAPLSEDPRCDVATQMCLLAEGVKPLTAFTTSLLAVLSEQYGVPLPKGMGRAYHDCLKDLDDRLR